MTARLRRLAAAWLRMFSRERPRVSFATRLERELERAEPMALRVSAWERNLRGTSAIGDAASQSIRTGS